MNQYHQEHQESRSAGAGRRLELLTQTQIGEIYHTHMRYDFPPEELPPLRILTERLERGIYDCLGLFEDGELRAYGFFVADRKRHMLLLDFLAVCRGGRGGGLGSAFLAEARQFYRDEDGILLECEAVRASKDEEEFQVRSRRIHFYEKNGCRVTEAKTMLLGVEMDILYLPLQKEDCDSAAEIDQMYRLMMGERKEKYTKVWRRSRRIRFVGGMDPETGGFREKKSLMAALGFEDWKQLPRIVSLVGGGGKTTTMYQLADELAEQGCRVLVTTSTHIQMPKHGQTAVVGHVRELEEKLWKGRILTAGRLEEGSLKLAMPDGLDREEELERLLQFTDVILIEADGAKNCPVKVPAPWEPVILPQTGLVIACAGLSALKKPFGQVCFRFAEHGGWLARGSEAPVEPEDLALILMDERGSRRQTAGRYYRIVLNQADDEQAVQAAETVYGMLPFILQEGCAVTAYRGI
ncbi:MAG: selenium cofactor biosynthesis protein YqeC [Eubacteriales bacterium]|nr:selenium cofactor biosynthesis protein YqeC [Eubacteriales bacterium]